MQTSTLETTLSSLMSAPVRSIGPDTSALDALELAKRTGVHHLPVVEAGRVLGLVCTCDLEEVALTTRVRAAIRRAPVTLDERKRPADALSLMRAELVGSVIVTRGDGVVGIVTREDLCRAGLDASDVANFHCDSCGAVTHLRREGDKGVLCLDCRSRAGVESPLDETGVVD